MKSRLFLLFLGYCMCPLALVAGRCALAAPVQEIDLVPSVSVTGTYDDNLLNEHQDTKSDFITAVTVGLDLMYKDEYKSFDAKAAMTHQFFEEYNEFDNTSGDLGFSYAQELTAYDRISLADRFSSTYEPATFEEQFVRTLGRYRYYANEIIVEYIRDVAKQTQVKAFYANMIDAFSVSTLQDSATNTLGLEVDHALSEETKLLGAYEISRRDFEDGPSATRNRILAGLQQDLTKQLTMEAKAGADIFDSYADETLEKPYVSFSLTEEFDALTRASVSIVRQYDTNPFAEDIFKEWRLVADFTRQPKERFGYTVSFFSGEGTYSASGLRDTFLGAGFDCFYRLSEKLKVVAGYEYSTVDSNDESREYDKNKTMLGLKMEF